MIVLLVSSIFGCNLNVDRAAIDVTNYQFNLEFNEEIHSINGKMKVDYFNKSEKPLGEIRFNLYPNAFREQSQQSVISLSAYDKCYYNGVSYGNIEILRVYDKSELDLNFQICGVDENILSVVLQNKVQPETYTSFFIEFTVLIPNINHRFGYGENTVNLGNFFPIACVYENGKWIEIEYCSYGDPFYSEIANYLVEITYPKNYIIASTGKEAATSALGDKKISILDAKAVRDFAIVLSKKFQVATEKVNNTNVSYYYYDDEQFQNSLETGKKAIKTYSELFGRYPYEEMNVVQSNFVHGGMEYPCLVLISDSIQDYETYTHTILHEIAHQWWYGVVGNNQTDYAWLDEGLTEFSCALFFKQNPDYNITVEDLVQQANSSYQVFQAIYGNVLGKINTSINRSLGQFSTEPEYFNLVYVKGFLLLASVSDLIGEQKVINCLKNYYSTFAFKTATPEDFIGCFERISSRELENYFDTWLNGKIIEFN